MNIINSIKGFRKATIMTPVFTALEVVMGVLIPYVTSWIIDKGIMAGDIKNVYLYGALMLGIAALSLFFGLMSGRCSAKASTGFAYNLREAMYTNIQTFSFSNIDKFSTAGLITRLTTDVNNLQNAFQMILRVSVRAPLNLIFSVLMCVFINPKMSLIFAVALIILGTVIYMVLSRTVKLFALVFGKYDDLNSAVQENVTAIRVVKAFVREDYENTKFRKAAEALYRLFVKTESLQAINHPVMLLVVYGCIISLSWWGAHFIVDGELTTGQLTSLLTYIMTILSSLMMLSMIFVTLTMSAASWRRVAEIIDEKADITSPAENALTNVANGSIDFKDVCFSFANEEGEYAIRDINLSIESGETIGIIGGTGCGKSTLGNLICRLYDTTKGAVCVGGSDVRRYDLTTLRDNVAIVQQTNTLFTGTILDNLRWGKEDATEEECIDVCRIACAHEFIEQMSDGYNTHIEQGGVNVSGGQKQRLCIARALLKQPKILILDDSTSACDTVTDKKIRQGLKDCLPQTTKVIISQRIQSVRDADRIVVMQSGMIDAIGTHDHLLASNAIYKEIYQLQSEHQE